MLEYIRKRKHRVAGILVASIVATTMIGFGLDFYYRGRRSVQQSDYAAKVNGDEITYAEHARRVRDISDRLRQQYVANFPQVRQFINIDQQAIDSLIAERLLKALISDLGLTASARQIEEQLLSLPFFGGQFSDTSFKMLLQSRGISAEGLEDQMRLELTQGQLRGAFMDLAVISQTEARDIFRTKNSLYQFNYAAVPASRFVDQVKLDDQAKLEAFFAENQENYRRPASVRYSFIKFDPKDAEKKVQVTKEDLEDSYNAKKFSLVEPKKVHLREIFLKRADNENALAKALQLPQKPEDPNQSRPNPEEEKKKQGEQILERLRNGESFDTVARSVTESDAGRQNGGDLGWTSIEDLDPTIRSAVDSLVPGEFTKLLQSSDGYRIVFLDEAKEPRQREFEEVKDKLEEEQRILDAPVYAYAEAEEFVSRLEAKEGKESFGDFARTEERAVLDSGGLLDERTDPQGALPGLTAKALAAAEGQPQVVQIESIPFVIFVDEKKQSEIPSLNDVRPKIEDDYRNEQAGELAKAFAENLLKTAKEKNLGVSDLAQQEKLELKQSEEFSRQTVKDPLFSSPGVKDAAFSLTLDNPLPSEPARVDNSFYVFQLIKLTPPDPAQFDKERKDIMLAEMMQGGNRSLMSLIGTLKARAEIEVDPSLFDRKK